MKRSICLISYLLAINLIPFSAVAATPTPSAKIKTFSPQNLTDSVHQVRVEFSEKMMALSRPDQQADIFNVNCIPALNGSARWQNETVWTYDFQTLLDGNKIPGGSRCQFELKKDIKTLAGKNIAGQRVFQFQVDGPNILEIIPEKDIVEDQIFIFKLDTEVDETSVTTNSYFVVEGKMNRVAAELVTGAQRDAILNAYYSENGTEGKDQPTLVIKAREIFPAKAKVRFIWGAGIKSKSSGISKAQASKFDFVVRGSFSAEFSCERENSKADCIPFSSMDLYFSAPIPTALAQAIYIQGSGITKKAELKGDEGSNTVQGVKFSGPFSANSQFKIYIPAHVTDEAGRTLSNQTKFPLVVKTADFPPLAKFSSTFGVLEAKEDHLLPVTLRNLETQVRGASALVGQSLRLDYKSFPAAVQWLKQITSRDWNDREKSVFAPQAKTKKFTIPLQKNGKAFEVVGIPLSGPGLHVIELSNTNLGHSLIGAGKTMYVPTVALVTNLAVHLKWGRENSMFWVTSLSDGMPVAGASVAVHDCQGTQLWNGSTDSSGLVNFKGNIKTILGTKDCSGDKELTSVYNNGFFVTAEKGDDFTFTHTSWTQGIETWRFGKGDEGINTRSPSWSSDTNDLAHTIFDRTLVRAGDTLHMKHILRRPMGSGFSILPRNELPTTMVISHDESDTHYEIPLTWDEKTSTAVSDFKVPQEAVLGRYSVVLKNGKINLSAGSFRVEEFKVPLFTGSIVLPKGELIRPVSVDALVSVNYQSGGPVSGLKAVVRYFLTPLGDVRLKDYEGFSFSNGGLKEGTVRSGEESSEPQEKVMSQPIQLDKNGTAHAFLANLTDSDISQTLNVEMEYRDSNGETQTVSQSKNLWPSSRQVGLKIDRWLSSGKDIELQLAITDLKGRPVPAATYALKAYKTTRYSHRTRLVGGFYSYENLIEVKEIPATWNCPVKTDAKGLVLCKAQVAGEGQISVVAETADAQGHAVKTHSDVYVHGSNNMWFEADNHDRIDLLAEKKSYDVNDVAHFQVRMPFQDATALVTVEREGILSAQVVHLSGKDPMISVPIKDGYAPNIYVSAFVVRGRVAASSGDTTAMIDLAKPAFKMGLASVNVKWKAHSLNVALNADKASYAPREEASFQVKVARADKSALPADAEVAVAVVDEGLLMLAPNNSWDLLKVMMNNRPLETETSTVQMQVVGKRHYGLKAVPHGGGGGGGVQHMTRELFDTLVYWNPRVKLDANGNAVVKFKMNDSLTRFRVVAIATAGAGLFGSGQTSVVTNQNLITTTSLPTLARSQDKFDAEFTFRNTTGAPLKATLKGVVTFKMADGTSRTQALPATLVIIDAKGSQTVTVAKVEVPEGAIQADYDVEVVDEAGHTQDHIKVSQEIRPSNYVRTLMSSLKQVHTDEKFEVDRPVDALTNSGGIQVSLTSSLASGLPTVNQFMNTYLFSSFESYFSQAVISADPQQWAAVMKLLPSYLDTDGLVKFYPGAESGDDVLTSYVLSGSQLGRTKLPDEFRNKMLKGLQDSIMGRLRNRNSKNQTPEVTYAKKVYALETLARYKTVNSGHLASLPDMETAQLGSATLISLMNVLDMLDTDGRQQAKKDQVLAALESRLTQNGNRISFSNKADALWLLNSSDSNMARLVLLSLQSKTVSQKWADRIPQLMTGLLAQNLKGSWDTTTANVYSTLALRAFSAVYEKTPVDGVTAMATSQLTQMMDWSHQKYVGNFKFPWPAQGRDVVDVNHKGSGEPWALVSTQAALVLKAPLFSGIEVKKSEKAISQKTAGQWTVGDVIEVHLKVKTNVESVQVALMDPIPAGAKIINSGSGRQNQSVWAAYEQLSYESYKAFYEWVPSTEFDVVYQIQLNQAGVFKRPSSRVQAIYNPEMFGEIPNDDLTVLTNH
jgi:uncharacterized protein YfaS (alpha-2-macroglobulin family)